MKAKQRKAKKERAKQHAEAQRQDKRAALKNGDMESQGYVKTHTGGWRRLASRRRDKSIDKE